MLKLNEVLKASKGLYVDDSFAMLWGKQLGGWNVTELTGTLPMTFRSNGTALINYRIYGTADGAGVQTENLLPNVFRQGATNNFISNNRITAVTPILCSVGDTFSVKAEAGFKCTFYLTNEAGYQQFVTDTSFTTENRVYDSGWKTTFTKTVTETQAKCIVIMVAYSDDSNLTPSDATQSITLVEGSTTLPYEPYGYKLPLTVTSGADSKDTDIFIGDSKLGADDFLDFEMQKIITNIETIVFTGTESSWRYYGKVNDHNAFYYDCSSSEALEEFKYLYCNKYETTILPSSSDTKNSTIRYQYISRDSAWNINRIYIFDDRFGNIVDFKDYLQSLYSTGDPLIITRQTATSESKDPPLLLPAIETFNGTNTLDSTETLGQVIITGKIKEAE